MNIWLLVMTFILSIISGFGLLNLSSIKKIKTQDTLVYHIFVAMCFITPALVFSYLFFMAPINKSTHCIFHGSPYGVKNQENTVVKI